MTVAGVTWDSIFPGNSNLTRKALYGSCLVQDYSASNNFATYSPFDSATGLLSSTLLGADGWQDIGYLDETGVEFTPTYTTADTMAWQTRQALRTDVTVDTEQAKVVALASSPLTDCLYNQVALASAGTLGTSNYSMVKPKVPQTVYRSVLFVGVDGSTGSYQFMATLYPRALMVKPDKVAWIAKTEIQVPLTFEAYPDTVAGYTIKRFRDGPGWRALGVPGAPTALTVGSKTATTVPITWTAPAGIPATSYTVGVVVASTGLAVGGATFLPTNPNATTAATVGGLVTATGYTITVTALNAIGTGGSTSINVTTS